MFGERVTGWLDRHEHLVDGLLAAGLVMVLALPWVFVDLRAMWLSTAIIVPVAWRRARPVASAAAVLSIAFTHWVVLFAGPRTMLPADAVVVLAVYSVTAYGPRWAGRTGLASGLLGAALAVSNTAVNWLGGLILGGFLATPVIAAWAFGDLYRVRRERVEALRERARLLEIERGQAARLAAATERTRIAREMHDVVAHSLAVIIAQADGGRYAAAGSPDAAGQALATIADTGRRALAELRRSLGVLRDDGTPGGTSAADPVTGELEPLGPQPGLTELAGLVERVRAGGLPVTLRVEGVQPPVDPGLALAVYRIVQEGLTNVIKHAGSAASAEVVLRWGGPAVEIEVLDDGRGAAAPSTPGGGHGLIGMRERAAAFGGGVHLAPRPGGGHVLRARLLVTAP